MKIVLYENKHRKELEELLKLFSKEVFNSGVADVDVFVDGHWAIYLAIHQDEVVGFSSFVINSYFGLREPTLGNSYIYVLPKYRRSKAMYLFSLQAGRISVKQNLPLEHYYSSEDSIKLSSKLKGEELYTTYLYSVEEVSRVFDKLNSKIKIKD